MSLKRSRAALEADLQAKQSPFVKYGTPLPPIDPDIRDDGSFVPVWQQEVRDDKGRRRLHGAFTGGFSAGYFNTVGSKEGWAPSAFVSSRSNRQKDDANQRVEDFMDEDDIAEREASQHLDTSNQFSGLGSTATDEKRLAGLIDIFRPQGDTMGIRLLQKMGWRKGQGVGARIRRQARTENTKDDENYDERPHLFAPDNTEMISFITNLDGTGLGYSSEAGSTPLASHTRSKPTQPRRNLIMDRVQENDSDGDGGMPSFAVGRKPGTSGVSQQPRKAPFSLGAFHDDDSDDDDAYGISPNVSYTRTIGADTDRGVESAVIKPRRNVGNPRLHDRPVFSKKAGEHTSSLKKCRDGRLPLDGFDLADAFDTTMSLEETKRKYPIPKAPSTWESQKSSSTSTVEPSKYTTTGEAAKASQLDPQKRGDILGEERLQGKCIFDYLTPETRDRIAKATGRTDLPPALSQPLPSSQSVSVAAELQPSEIPELDKSTASAALARGIGGWMPYADDETKRARYRAFLEYCGGIQSQVPPRPSHLKKDAWLHELREFAHAARVFKPVSGLMASRFMSANSGPGVPDPDKPILDVPSERKKDDPAEEAARLGMFGPLTRSALQFYPTRLVCKRFNVKPPAHSDFSAEARSETATRGTAASTGGVMASELISKQTMEGIIRDASASSFGQTAAAPVQVNATTSEPLESVQDSLADVHNSIGSVEVNSERNEALESQRAGETVFKAIFGSDDEDDE